MLKRWSPLVLALILAIGVLAAPAGAQSSDGGFQFFLEAYKVLRDEALAQPTTETLLRGAEAGLRTALRDDGQNPNSLSSLALTGQERPDLEQILTRIEQVRNAIPGRPMAAVYGAVSGMVAALRDVNSAFFAPDAFAAFMRRTHGEDFVGIGIVIEERVGQTVITEVVENSPASEAGLRSGDIILAVDGISAAGLTLDQISQMIRGTEATTVTLRIRRPGQGELSIQVTRRRIQTRVVSARLLPSGIGYLRLTQFTQNSDEAFAEELQSLLNRGAKGIILDLRGNPGGLLDASVNIASHFLDSGIVVTLESGRGQSTPYGVRPRTPRFKGPLTVLVDRGSASASEVVAGALQDAGIKIVGTRTYGKATVQALYRFRDGSGLRLTISRYLTPLGRDIDSRGLSPDIEVATGGVPIGSPDDAPLNRAVGMLQQAVAVLPRPAP